MTFVVGVEGRVAHQAVHAGFGAQQAVGVFAFQADGGAVDTGDFAVVLLHDFHFEAFTLAIAHIHTQQHAGPIFGFGAAGAGRDVDKAVVHVGRLVEHALEFELGHLFFQLSHVLLNRSEAVFITLFQRHIDE